MSLGFLFNLVVGYSLGYFYAFMSILAFLWRAIRGPIRFKNELFNVKKRDIMPACLNDPTLGTHGFLHLEKVKIHYVACGDEGKPLMLFVHGFPEFWYSWRYQIRYFSKDYRVVAMDMRGYSDSDKPSGYKNYHMDYLTGDIKQLIPALGYKSCVLVGHDWGGVIAFTFAARHPDMVDQLVVMNAPHPATFQKYLRKSFEQFRKSWYTLFFQVPYVPEFIISWNDMKAFEQMFKKSRTSAMGMVNDNVTQKDIEAYKYAFSKPGALTCPINFYRAAFNADPASLASFPVFNKPTLFIWGCKDGALNKELAPLAEKYVTDLTIRYIQDASHWVQMDTPDQVNELMKEFLDQH